MGRLRPHDGESHAFESGEGGRKESDNRRRKKRTRRRARRRARRTRERNEDEEETVHEKEENRLFRRFRAENLVDNVRPGFKSPTEEIQMRSWLEVEVEEQRTPRRAPPNPMFSLEASMRRPVAATCTSYASSVLERQHLKLQHSLGRTQQHFVQSLRSPKSPREGKQARTRAPAPTPARVRSQRAEHRGKKGISRWGEEEDGEENGARRFAVKRISIAHVPSSRSTLRRTAMRPVDLAHREELQNIKNMEALKNKCRTIFGKIGAAKKRLREVRMRLGVNVDPRAMQLANARTLSNLEKQINAASLDSDIRRKQNRALRAKIDQQRSLLQNAKRDVAAMQASIRKVEKRIAAKSRDEHIEGIERAKAAVRKMERRAKRQEEEFHSGMIRKGKHLHRLTKSNVKDYHSKSKVFQPGHRNSSVIEDTGVVAAAVAKSEVTARREHFKEVDEQATKEAKSYVSPVKWHDLGAFARYDGEEATGAFTQRDRAEQLSLTAKANWKIARKLWRKYRVEEEIKEARRLWDRVSREASAEVQTVDDFVRIFLEAERFQFGRIQQINKLKDELRLTEMKSARLRETIEREKVKAESSASSVSEYKESAQQQIDALLKKTAAAQKDGEVTRENIEALQSPIRRLLTCGLVGDTQSLHELEVRSHGEINAQSIHSYMGLLEQSINVLLMVHSDAAKNNVGAGADMGAAKAKHSLNKRPPLPMGRRRSSILRGIFKVPQYLPEVRDLEGQSMDATKVMSRAELFDISNRDSVLANVKARMRERRA
eukprot:g1312.t1